VCGECGSLLYRSSTGYPGTLVVKAGCMDGEDFAESFVPAVEIFTRSRLSVSFSLFAICRGEIC